MQKKAGNSQAKKPNEDNRPQEEYIEKQGNSHPKKPNEGNGPQEECRKKQGNSHPKKPNEDNELKSVQLKAEILMDEKGSENRSPKECKVKSRVTYM